jgi:signal transduction histidine kinase
MAEVAHELRTPLAVVQGRLEGLLDGIYARDDARLGEILEETRVLARLVGDLRTLANAESGTLTLQKEPTDIVMLAQDVVKAFSQEAESGNVSVHLNTSPDLPLIDIDSVRIREVLANLLSNALRHTPAGGTITIKAEVSNQRLLVSVADSGSGIPAEELSKIFDRFYKGAASRGSGLGLTIARNLVLLHKGEIWAESRQGEGATLTVALPVS